MSFQFKKNREVVYPVVIKLLPEDGKGDLCEFKISTRFKLLTRPEYTAWTTGDFDFFETKKEDQQKTTSADEQMLAVLDRLNNSVKEEAQKIRLRELVKRIKDWDENDVIDGDGNPVPFDVNYLIDVIEFSPTYVSAFEMGLIEASRDAPVKN